MARIVKFSCVDEKSNGYLSVMSDHKFTVRHQEYPSAHHYYLCEMVRGTSYEERILHAKSFWDVEKLRKEAEEANAVRQGWDQDRLSVMLLCCYCKFKQNEGIQSRLLATGSQIIVYQDSADCFWGDGLTVKDGVQAPGKNMLGVVLMSVRKRINDEIRKEARRTARLMSSVSM